MSHVFGGFRRDLEGSVGWVLFRMMFDPAVAAAPELRDRFIGCLLAGAIGDSLIEGAWPAGTVTDNTQLTLWTAEGLIRANQRFVSGVGTHVPSIVRQAYLRWLETQREATFANGFERGLVMSGWLIIEPELHVGRGPRSACISGLRAADMGSIERPLNDANDAGAVVRVAPVGLVVPEPFGLACEIAALTHGHPTGHIAAGAFAVIVAHLVDGKSVVEAVNAAQGIVADHQHGGEMSAALEAAVTLAKSTEGSVLAAEQLESLGTGIDASSALAIAVACVLVSTDPMAAMFSAVNHPGDTDATGTICGNILGAALGSAWLTDELLNQTEMTSLIEAIAGDLFSSFDERPGAGAPDLDQYPAY